MNEYTDRMCDEMDALRGLQLEYNKRVMAMQDNLIREMAGVNVLEAEYGSSHVMRLRASHNNYGVGDLVKITDMAGVSEDLMGPAERCDWMVDEVLPNGYMTFRRYPALSSTIDLEPPSIEKYYDARLLSKPVPTMTYDMFVNKGGFNIQDYLVDACLEKGDVAGYRFAKAHAIVDNSWVVNLKDIKQGEPIMEPFLMGVRDEVKRAWEQSHVDVSIEMMALQKIYKDALDKSAYQEQSALEGMERAMKNYMKVKEDRQAIKSKLMSLESKLAKPVEEPEKDEEEDD